MPARHLHISGLVQGVAYRESMRHEAERLGITGWVRNRLDGSVEAVIEGDETALAAMLEWVRRGPPAARVSNVETRECDGGYARFERRPTF
jgi:acylphosphatase